MRKWLTYLVLFAQLLQPVAALGETAPKKAKKIETPDMLWVDAPGFWSRFGKGNADGSGGDNGAGKGNGKGNGSGAGGKGGAGSGTEFTQNAGDGNGSKKGDGGSPGQSGSMSTPGGEIRVHSRWWPVCAFVSEDTPEDKANKALKEMIAMADECGVNVVVWPKTVKKSSWIEADPSDVNSKSVKQCNLPTGLAAHGSATSFVTDDLTAARMCESKYDHDNNPNTPEVYDPSTAGCAELREGTSLKKETQTAMEGSGHGHKSGGKVAASIEVPSGTDGSTVAHEAQGHSQMGKPNGKTLGNGIGEENEPPGASGPGKGWSAAGCKVMYDTALPNDRRFGFDPKRTTYYVKPRDPNAYYDIANDPPIFQDSPSFPLTASNGTIDTPPGQTIRMIDEAKPQKTPPKDAKAQNEPQQTAKMEDGEDGRHRRKNVVSALLDKLKDEPVVGLTEADPTAALKAEPRAPIAGSPVKAGGRITYDESAPKGKAGGGETVTSAEPPPGDAAFYSGESADAPAAQADRPMHDYQGSSGMGGVGAGSTITFDESAKGGSVGAAYAAGNTRDGSSRSEETDTRVGRDGADGGSRSPASLSDSDSDSIDENGVQVRRPRSERARNRQGRLQTAPHGSSAAGRASQSRKAPIN